MNRRGHVPSQNVFTPRGGIELSERFRFALKQVQPAQWQAFERLASSFLSDEFGELRTLAAPSGDGGRDATLFTPSNDPEIALQYSLERDWKAKVRRTAKRLADHHDQVDMLIFATPLEVGAAADKLKRDIRTDFHVHVDIRDRNWFTERSERSATTRSAAGTFSSLITDPLLLEAGVIDSSGSTLSNHESRAALLYLVLQREDDDLDRQLTKLCFDALVKAVLRDTDNDRRLSRTDIRENVLLLLPSHESDEVFLYVDRALERLTKRAIRHWTKEDEFCLTFDERNRLAEGLARLALLNDEFGAELMNHLVFVAGGMEVDLHVTDESDVLVRVRRVMERFLFERGEAFVESLRTGQTMMFVGEELQELATKDAAKHTDTSSLRDNTVPLVSLTIERALLHWESESVQKYLRAVADAYTLFAFMKETPNVQSAVTKLFANGEIWIDTSAVLPMLAETLLEPEHRGYSQLIAAAMQAGARFYVTNGVVNEIETHLSNCVNASRSASQWTSRTPFLLASYIWSGRPISEFYKWIEQFRGNARPHDDLLIYLDEILGLKLHDLNDLVERADEQFRWQAQEYWREVHVQRRKRFGSVPVDETVRQLSAHDVENFVGVIQRRKGEQVDNPFGFTSWWLTLDRFAPGAAEEIAGRCGLPRLDSPVMSFDFLTYYLAVGPARMQLEKSRERMLPLGVDTSLLDALPKDLLEAAEMARRDVTGQDDRIVRRKIRDHLDQAKLRRGRIGRTGIEAIEQDIRSALEAAVVKKSR
jgi:hypothetical protein